MEVVSIVEGHGEVEALPVLIRRILPQARVLRPFRSYRSSLIKNPAREVETALALASSASPLLLVLLDADDDCPAKLGPKLSARVRKTRSDVEFAVVLAKAEFESWFIAAAASLRGQRGLPGNLIVPPNAESIRGAKEWLQTQAGRYSPTIDQPKLAARFSLDEARAGSASFARFERKLLEYAASYRDQTK